MTIPPLRPAAATRLAAAAALSMLLVAGTPVDANERHFTYTYETAVLPRGAREIEVWSTPRIGKQDYYVAFDERLEFEVGVTDRLMTAFYLNWSAVTFDTPTARESQTEFQGVSSEWKYKLSDPVADPIGLGLYGEVLGGPDEVELEAKLLADKQVGDLLFAGNLVLANEWELERTATEEEAEAEQEVEIDLAATWFARPGLSAGLELRNHNEIVEGEWDHSALFAGPVVAYATDAWWVALTVLPQLPAIKKEGNGARVLDEHEKLEARILFSFHL